MPPKSSLLTANTQISPSSDPPPGSHSNPFAKLTDGLTILVPESDGKTQSARAAVQKARSSRSSSQPVSPANTKSAKGGSLENRQQQAYDFSVVLSPSGSPFGLADEETTSPLPASTASSVSSLSQSQRRWSGSSRRDSLGGTPVSSVSRLREMLSSGGSGGAASPKASRFGFPLSNGGSAVSSTTSSPSIGPVNSSRKPPLPPRIAMGNDSPVVKRKPLHVNNGSGRTSVASSPTASSPNTQRPTSLPKSKTPEELVTGLWTTLTPNNNWLGYGTIKLHQAALSIGVPLVTTDSFESAMDPRGSVFNAESSLIIRSGSRLLQTKSDPSSEKAFEILQLLTTSKKYNRQQFWSTVKGLHDVFDQAKCIKAIDEFLKIPEFTPELKKKSVKETLATIPHPIFKQKELLENILGYLKGIYLQNIGRRAEVFLPLRNRDAAVYVYPSVNNKTIDSFPGIRRVGMVGCLMASVFECMLKGDMQHGPVIRHNMDLTTDKPITHILYDPGNPNPYQEMLFENFKKQLAIIKKFAVPFEIDRKIELQLFFHLPDYDYIFFVIGLYLQGKIIFDAMLTFIAAVLWQSKQCREEIAKISKEYNYEVWVESPFDNFFKGMRSDIEMQTWSPVACRRAKQQISEYLDRHFGINREYDIAVKDKTATSDAKRSDKLNEFLDDCRAKLKATPCQSSSSGSGAAVNLAHADAWQSILEAESKKVAEDPVEYMLTSSNVVMVRRIVKPDPAAVGFQAVSIVPATEKQIQLDYIKRFPDKLGVFFLTELDRIYCVTPNNPTGSSFYWPNTHTTYDLLQLIRVSKIIDIATANIGRPKTNEEPIKYTLTLT